MQMAKHLQIEGRRLATVVDPSSIPSRRQLTNQNVSKGICPSPLSELRFLAFEAGAPLAARLGGAEERVRLSADVLVVVADDTE